MKKDYATLNLGTFTVRMPIKLMEELDAKSGAGMKYLNRSEALRSLVQLGLRVESMLEIYNDPEKKKEFEEKLANLFQDKNFEKTFETMSERDLNAVMFIAGNLKDKKIQQLVLDVKKS